MISKIITRNDTAANWASSTIPLALSQFGYDTTNKILKIGDGSTLWANLPTLGSYSDAGVTFGEFSGTDNPIVSINVGSSKAKKIYITCSPTAAASSPKGSILSLYYDAVANQSRIVYQGASDHYVGVYTDVNFTVSRTVATSASGKVENIYNIGFTSSEDPNYAKFINGIRYSWYCITKDVPANYEVETGNSIAGSFVGADDPIHKIYVGVNSVNKVYISCLPSGTSSAPTGSIYSLFYNADTGEKSITYQGGSANYIGHYGENNFSMSLSNGYLSIGFTSSSNPTYAKFISGVNYNWIVTTNNPYSAPSGSKTITTNGTHDVASYASAIVNVASGGFTHQKSGTYKAPTPDTLLSNKITIDVGFKPKVFAMFIQGSTQIDNNTNLKIITTFFVTDNGGNIIYAGTNFGSKASSSNSNGNAGYTENPKNYFYPSSTGVYGGTASNVYLKGGATYKWFAVG